MVVVVFRSRLRPGVEDAITTVGQQMYALAAALPGFLSYKDFLADDGENVSLITFESLETLTAWRDHPEHREVQERGRREFFSEYHIQVCTPIREAHFPSEGGPHPTA